MMFIGQRLRALRESKHLSQGDIERRTGLLRCYTSRVEHGHTVPSVETLEKYARALEVPMYRLFYEGENPPTPRIPGTEIENVEWGKSERHQLHELISALRRMNDRDREVLLRMAQQMAGRKRNRILRD